MKKIIIFFDLESWYETPYVGQFNVDDVACKITKILDRYKARAVFNTCGIVAEKHPELIKKLNAQGHEIASHGYLHENFSQMNENDLHEVCEKTERAIKKAIGEKITGFRSPWAYHSPLIYKVFRERGYKWASNVNYAHPEIYSRPDNKGSIYNFAKIYVKFRNLFYSEKVTRKEGLLEIPLLSSTDADLLSVVHPTQKSPKLWLDFAYQSLIKQYKRSKDLFDLNFHPWLIGSSNRLILLNNILSYLSKNKFILARDLIE